MENDIEDVAVDVQHDISIEHNTVGDVKIELHIHFEKVNWLIRLFRRWFKK